MRLREPRRRHRCLLYAPIPYMVCTVHPEGISTKYCLDFRPDPNKEPQEQWNPEGCSFYDGELVRDRSRLSREEQLAMLDTHPFFTGVCPKCGIVSTFQSLLLFIGTVPVPTATGMYDSV